MGSGAGCERASQADDADADDADDERAKHDAKLAWPACEALAAPSRPLAEPGRPQLAPGSGMTWRRSVTRFSSVCLVAACLGLGLGSTSQMAQAQVGEIASKRAAAKAAPRDVSALTSLGTVELRAGHFAESRRAFEAAAQLSHADPRALMRVAEVAIAQGDYKAAKSLCRRLFPARGTPSAVAHVCMARAYLAWNRSARAFDELAQALSLDPSSSEAQLVLGHAHRLRAAVAESETAYTSAKADALLEAEAELGLGRLYAAVGRKVEAIAALRAVLAREPGWPEAQLELGLLLGHSDEARTLLAAALAGRPGWSEAARALGDARREGGDLAGAQSAYHEALKADSMLAPAHAGLGEVLFRSGKLDEAQAALEKSLSLVANNAGAALTLAEVFAAQGKVEAAVEQFRHAADLDPRDPAALLRATQLLIAAQRATTAAAYLDRLLAAHPGSATGLALYGDIMLQRGDKTAAKAFYEQALKGQGAVDRARIERALHAL